MVLFVCVLSRVTFLLSESGFKFVTDEFLAVLICIGLLIGVSRLTLSLPGSVLAHPESLHIIIGRK